jgi:hypothetical protein
LISAFNIIALVAIMLAMGMGVEFRTLMASVQPVRLIVLGVVANYVVAPAITVGLLRLFHADPMVSVGFLALAVCPGAPIGPRDSPCPRQPSLGHRHHAGSGWALGGYFAAVAECVNGAHRTG